MIFTIATVGENFGRWNTRRVGWFRTYADAEQIVVGNYGDICENFYYEYAVIERFEPGLYPISRESVWYKFEKKDEEVTASRVDTPEKFRNIVGWGLG